MGLRKHDTVFPLPDIVYPVVVIGFLAFGRAFRSRGKVPRAVFAIRRRRTSATIFGTPALSYRNQSISHLSPGVDAHAREAC